MQANNHNKQIKREWHPIKICAILFLFALFFSIIMVDNSYEASRVHDTGQGNVNSNLNSEDVGHSHNNLDVVIDPGHGGNDPGKVSADGTLEKDLNLEISYILKEELESRGISVLMLRDEDKNLATEGATNIKSSDMKNRVGMINASKGVIFVSVHQNSFTDSSVRGAQVFYHDSSEESEAFAKILQEKLNEIDPHHAREAKAGNDYYILNKTVCPGVILECGFLSCPQEAALLVSEQYQQKIASAIADAIEDTY